jgi:hypothetical protein
MKPEEQDVLRINEADEIAIFQKSLPRPLACDAFRLNFVRTSTESGNFKYVMLQPTRAFSQ